MINARPHLNGSSCKDFADAYGAINAAEEAIQDAMRELSMNVFHGRNYQHIGRETTAHLEAQQADLTHMEDMRSMIRQLSRLRADIEEAIK